MKTLANLAAVTAAALLLGACGTAEPTAAWGEAPDTASVAPSTATTPEAQPTTAAPTRPAAPTTEHVIASAAPRTALALLATLAVKGRAPMTGYDRDRYGPAWADTNRNGCDTRNDVLDRDLRATTVKPGTYGCVILSGDLDDPYTATRIHFVRGGASEVDIDHVVALGNSWATGAQTWPVKKRVAFANDPLNLLAVDSGANRQKGAGDAATWLPANKRYRCAYVARQVGVKAKYQLWVTSAERAAIARVLSGCRSQVATAGGNPTLAPIAAGSGTTTQPTTRATTSGSGGTDPRFGTCKEAKANGYGPYTEGKDPEYDWYRDADSDGVVCE